MKEEPDFRDEIPMWVRYVECIGGGHDKWYEVRVDMDDDGVFYLTKRWGRRPDLGNGQRKVETYRRDIHATGVADAMISEKLRKGYHLAERPRSADRRVHVVAAEDVDED